MNERHCPPPPEPIDADNLSTDEALVLAYGPYLRMVVRRRMSPRLRSRFDSQDVVQSVWGDLFARLRRDGRDGTLPEPGRLRPYLVRLTLNRFIDFYRRSRGALRHEQPLPRGAAFDHPDLARESPSAVVQAGEVWERLLALAAPGHHEVIRLKSVGTPLAEIAARTGLHESSVRRILYDLFKRFDAEDAGV